MNVEADMARKIAYHYRRLGYVQYVAEHLKIGHRKVVAALRQLGIQQKIKSVTDEEIESDVVSQYQKLHSVMAVAKKLRRSTKRVLRILKKKNIEVKPVSRLKRKPDMNARQKKLFESHLKLINYGIKSVGAWRAKRAGMEVDDLYSAGLIGLWRAAMNFNKNAGCQFATFAYKLIKYQMLDAIEISRFGKRNNSGKLIDQSAFLPYKESYDDKTND